MSGFIEVMTTGLYSSIQDQGRIGFRKYGVPTSGVMDEQSATMANHLLNNKASASVMEITMTGPKLFFSNPTLIAITGADISPKKNDDPIARHKVIAMNTGDVLSFGALQLGLRCYLAVKGGFQTPIVMNSYSYFSGVTRDKMIEKGDQLPIMPYASAQHHFAGIKPDESFFNSPDLMCTKGPEFELLSLEHQKEIFEDHFTVSQDNNRMGYRLDSPLLQYPSNYNMLTSSVLPGTVQLTPSGKLIVLMKDCQTTGGYPRILQLTQQGINKLAQKKAADQISFALIP